MEMYPFLNGTTVAPDVFLQRVHPKHHQGVAVVEQLRAPFVAELEYGNRTPKGLMLQLDAYLGQVVADYVLGIKVYKRTDPSRGQQLPAGANRPFAAIALLWRRGAALQGGMARLEGVWSFGTQALHTSSRRAFCVRQRGFLQQVMPAQIVHPPASYI
jgi:hypothetical protein